MKTVGAVLIILFVVVSLMYSCRQYTDCSARGGELVKTVGGTYKCVKGIEP